MAQQPIVMTAEQFQHIAGAFEQSRREQRDESKLTRATNQIDRCDGVIPENTRAWLRDIDGWQIQEGITESFVLDLALATASGHLLEELRRWMLAASAADKNWNVIRAKVTEQFLSACEQLKLQRRLETLKQAKDETTPAYIRRFRIEATRAYPATRAESEEQRVVAAFLRGFTDRAFAERLFRSGKVDRLAHAISAGLEREAVHEKMMQAMGTEPMEVDAAATTTPPPPVSDHLTVDRVTMDALQKQLKQVTTELGKLKSMGVKPTTDRGMGTKNRTDARGRREDKKIVCYGCQGEGHIKRNCPTVVKPTMATPQASLGGH